VDHQLIEPTAGRENAHAPVDFLLNRPAWPHLLLALAIVPKALVLQELGAHPLLQPTGGLDGAVYVELARRVAGDDLGAGREAFFVSPLYVYFLAPFVAMGDPGLWWARVAQITLGTAAVGLVFATTRKLGATFGAWVAAAAFALTGVVTFNEILILQSALDPFLMALSLYLLARAVVNGGGRAYLAAGFAMGVLALNRPNALLVGLAVVAAIAVMSRPRAWRLAGVCLAGLVLAIAPVTIRNAVVARDFVPISSHGGLNFYIGNNARADGTYKRVDGITPDIRGQERDSRALAEKALGRPLRSSQVDGYFYGQAWGWIAAHPLDALDLFLRKMRYVLGATDIALNYSYAFYSSEESRILPWLFVGAGLLVPIGAVGLGLRWADASLKQQPWFMVGLVYALSVALFFVTSRYRLPILVPLALGAGFLVERIVVLIRTKPHRQLMWIGLGVFVAAISAHANTRTLDDGWSAEATEKLLYLVDSRRDAEASQLLERLGASRTHLPSLYARTAQAYQVRGESVRALELYERALAADPAALADQFAAAGELALHSGNAIAAERLLRAAVVRDPASGVAWEKLGLALAGLERTEAAAQALEKACALTPDSPSAHLNLAVVYGQMGRIDEATRQVDDALRLRPDYPEAEGLRKALVRLR
jgi:tetratricopeptide (TPR) repeat protein